MRPYTPPTGNGIHLSTPHTPHHTTLVLSAAPVIVSQGLLLMLARGSSQGRLECLVPNVFTHSLRSTHLHSLASPHSHRSFHRAPPSLRPPRTRRAVFGAFFAGTGCVLVLGGLSQFFAPLNGTVYCTPRTQPALHMLLYNPKPLRHTMLCPTRATTCLVASMILITR